MALPRLDLCHRRRDGLDLDAVVAGILDLGGMAFDRAPGRVLLDATPFFQVYVDRMFPPCISRASSRALAQKAQTLRDGGLPSRRRRRRRERDGGGDEVLRIRFISCPFRMCTCCSFSPAGLFPPLGEESFVDEAQHRRDLDLVESPTLASARLDHEPG